MTIEIKYKMSIIIVNYNNNTGLKKTLHFLNENIREFIENSDIEIVIIDGLSLDNSINTLKEYSNIINTLVIEKDQGIYDAMNKGIHYSNGRYCYFLNTNDTFNSELLSEIIHVISLDIYDLLVFPVNRYNENNQYIGIKPLNIIKPDDFINDMPVCHQGTVFKRKHLLYYDTSYKIIADKDLIYRYVKNGSKIKYFNSPLMDYYENGYSINNTSQWKFENIIFCLKNFKNKNRLFYYIMSFLKSKLF